MMMRKILTAILFTMLIVPSASSAEKAVRVNQPAYYSMSFYVCKPVNVPKDFYVTFDGYLVYRDAKGVWYYGSAEKSGIAKTGYIVGSVLPSVVRLKPYNTKISSVAPILGSNKVIDPPSFPNVRPDSKADRMIIVPPERYNEVYYPKRPSFSPHASDWTQNSNFLAAGRWQKSISKMGVLYRPKMPVAWKGDFPEVVYVWTGMEWKQISAKTRNSNVRNILRREIYDLTVYTNKINRLNWTDDDTYVLAHYAAMWGYEWVGQIILGRDFY